MVVVRRLRDPGEFERAVEVHLKAWGGKDYREASPAHLLRALSDNGGIVLGAFIGGELVGISYGWVVWGEKPYFYSHATGVSEGSKYRGVGYSLKLRQREEVLELGLDLIKWTFDPLQSLNAYFNLEKLGAVFREYMVNYYGEMRDPINRGLGTDRVKAEWWISSRRVVERIRGKAETPGRDFLERECGASVALEVRFEGGVEKPRHVVLDNASDIVLVGIPRSISLVRDKSLETAVLWRKETRNVYRRMLGLGYLGVGYSKGKEGYVVLARSSLEEALNLKDPLSRCLGWGRNYS